MPETVFFNDKFVPLSEAQISVSNPGFLDGWGLFETMRSFKGRIVYLDRHLDRIDGACKFIDMHRPAMARNKLIKNIESLVRMSGFSDARVRVVFLKSAPRTEVLITAKKYTPFTKDFYERGFKVCVSSFRQDENSYFAQLKTINRLFYRMILEQARKKKFDESLILNTCGDITEGSRSNIFFVKDKTIYTPELSCGCLPGITRSVIFDFAKANKIKLCEGKFTLKDISYSDEAFLTNSMLGVMPVESIERCRISKGVRSFAITNMLMKKYSYVVKNGTQ